MGVLLTSEDFGMTEVRSREGLQDVVASGTYTTALWNMFSSTNLAAFSAQTYDEFTNKVKNVCEERTAAILREQDDLNARKAAAASPSGQAGIATGGAKSESASPGGAGLVRQESSGPKEEELQPEAPEGILDDDKQKESESTPGADGHLPESAKVSLEESD